MNFASILMMYVKLDIPYACVFDILMSPVYLWGIVSGGLHQMTLFHAPLVPW